MYILLWMKLQILEGDTSRTLLVGRLSEGGPSKSYLTACKQLEKTNHVTILRFVNECLMNFFRPEVVPTEKILLKLSDAASYMIKAGHQFKLLYPNLIHSTCLAHGQKIE
jgi:hypothetical protein